MIAFQKTVRESFGLAADAYISLPSLSLGIIIQSKLNISICFLHTISFLIDCCLKQSDLRVELLSESDMLDFINRAKRGGMTIGGCNLYKYYMKCLEI